METKSRAVRDRARQPQALHSPSSQHGHTVLCKEEKAKFVFICKLWVFKCFRYILFCILICRPLRTDQQ